MKSLKLRELPALAFGLVISCICWLPPSAGAQTLPTEDDRFGWGQNIGYVNFRPVPGGLPPGGTGTPAPGSDGIQFGATFLSGEIWSQNVGWMSLGDGTPVTPPSYSQTAADYGVNIDTGTAHPTVPTAFALEGHAWSPSVGWIDFEQTTGKPFVDTTSGEFYGHAWARNIGWINLTELFVDVDPLNMRIELLNVSAPEGDGTICFTVQLDGPATGAITINHSITGGNATAGVDYTDSTGGVLNFAAGHWTDTICFTIVPDEEEEGDETITLQLTSASIGTIIAGGDTALGVIIDGILTNGLNIYWTDQGGGGNIDAVDIDGNNRPATPVSEDPNTPAGVAVTKDNIYWIENQIGAIRIADRADGGNIQSLLNPFTIGTGVDLTIRDTTLYLLLNTGTIQERNLSDGSLTAGGATFITGLTSPTQLTTDDTFIYWTESGASDKVRKATRSTGAIQPDIHTSLVDPVGIDIANGKLYWTERGTGIANGTVNRSDLDGMNVQNLASSLLEPRSLDVEDKFAYWLELNNQRLQRGDALAASIPTELEGSITTPADLDVSPNSNLSLTDASPDGPTVAPTALPTHDGSLTVTTSPAMANGQWRFFGEIFWRDSGDNISNLAVGSDYTIEFKGVPNYDTPADITIAIISGVNPAQDGAYVSNPSVGTGSVKFTVGPVGLDDESWRIDGFDPALTFRDSEETAAGVPSGQHIVEFKAVPGRQSPAPRLVTVVDSQLTQASAVYDVDVTTGGSPGAVSFAQVSGQRPYYHVGQIETQTGYGTGFAVRDQVILTAAHVIFDDINFVFVPEVRFFQQRHRDTAPNGFEPPAIEARGALTLSGYAAARIIDNTPGVSSLASQQLDVAAIYFVEAVWRGGFGGYLATNGNATNPFLTGVTANKMLVGYPADSDGLMVETPQVTAGFTQPDAITAPQVFSIPLAQMHGKPGMSGGPVYVAFDPDDTGPLLTEFYPAGVYLGGTGQSVVRAIDRNVHIIIKAAELASDEAGDNSTGGGLDVDDPGSGGDSFGETEGDLDVTINIDPDGRWRIDDPEFPDWELPQSGPIAVEEGTYTVEYQAVAGFVTPANGTVEVAAGQANIISAVYESAFNTFIDFFFTPGEQAVLDVGLLDDTEFDGVINLLEWAFGLAPDISDIRPQNPATNATGLPVVAVEDIAGADRLTIEYVRRVSTIAPTLAYECQFVDALTGWTTGGVPVGAPVLLPGGLFERCKFRDTESLTTKSRRYGRIQVTHTPAP